MKALVVGGAGFIGFHIAERLAREGTEVAVIDNLSRGKLLKARIRANYNWNELSSMKMVHLVKGDIRDMGSIRAAFRGANFIVHAAAQTAVTTSIADPMTDFMVNALGTLNVLEAARRYSDDATLVYTSTNKVYGDNISNIPIITKGDRYEFGDSFSGVPTDFPVDHAVHSPYGCSKLAGDLYFQDYGKAYGMNTAIFRMSCIYGPRQLGVSDQGWVAWFARAMVEGRKITIYGDGKQVRDILYVEDLIDAFLRCKDHGRSLRGEVFNIGGGPSNTISLLELVRLLAELGAPKARLAFAHWRPADQKVYVSDITKAKRILGWAPHVGVREGVSRLLQWIQEGDVRTSRRLRVPRP